MSYTEPLKNHFFSQFFIKDFLQTFSYKHFSHIVNKAGMNSLNKLLKSDIKHYMHILVVYSVFCVQHWDIHALILLGVVSHQHASTTERPCLKLYSTIANVHYIVMAMVACLHFIGRPWLHAYISLAGHGCMLHTS